ncbi:MAG: hypothetical protein R2873_13035 [Caldilineaceae bacterium]
MGCPTTASDDFSVENQADILDTVSGDHRHVHGVAGAASAISLVVGGTSAS